MKTLKQITKKYEGNNFNVEIIRNKTFPKRIKIISWWGLGDTYEHLCKELRREGYTLFG
jgi:hypothetical protein